MGTIGTPVSQDPSASVNKNPPGTVSPERQRNLAKPLQDRVQAWLDDKWTNYRSAYIVYHQLVWQSILFYANQSWIEWDTSRKVWAPAEPDDEWTPQPRINRFSPAIDAVASLTNRMPEIEAVPRQVNDVKAQEVADIANDLADYFINQNGLREDFKGQEDKLGEAGYSFVLSGCAFTHTYPVPGDTYSQPVMQNVPAIGIHCPQCNTFSKDPVDPAGPPPSICAECQGPVNISSSSIQQPAVDPATGEPVTTQQQRWKVNCDILTPTGVLPRQGCHGMHDTGFLMYAERLSLDQVWETLQYEAEPDSQFLDGYSLNYETALNFWYTGYSSQSIRTKESCLVLKIFIQPGKVRDIPEGAYAVKIGDTFVKCAPWPYGTEWPITKGDYLKMLTLFFPRSIAFDIAEIQRELNGYESIIKLHAMTSSADPVVVDDNTMVQEITGRADRVIRWRSLGPGSKEPHRMGHGVLDDGVYKQRQELKSEIENITGAVSVYRGQQPGSVTAASAISQLRGQAELMFSKPTTNWNTMWKETVRKGVKYQQQYLQPWEIAEIAGPGKEIAIQLFKQADLDTMLDWVATAHGLPRTRDEKKAELLELFDRGALDIQDPNVREHIYELFGDTGLESQFNKDATRARMENQVMSQGGQPTFMPEIEDLTVHFQLHSEFIKGLDFDKLETPVKQIIMEHALATKQALMEMAAQAQAQAAGPGASAGGTAGGPGGPPKPNGHAGGRDGGNNKNPNRTKPGATPKPKPGQHPVTGHKGGPSQMASPGPVNAATPTGPNGPGAALIPGGNR